MRGVGGKEWKEDPFERSKQRKALENRAKAYGVVAEANGATQAKAKPEPQPGAEIYPALNEVEVHHQKFSLLHFFSFFLSFDQRPWRIFTWGY